jgi:hypothetical protein
VKLPNGDRAVVPLEKLTGYSLNAEHGSGRNKAYLFEKRLGLTADDAAFLRDTLLQQAKDADAKPASPTVYGERYVIDFDVTTDMGNARVRSAWIVRKDEDFPRLTSCYIIDGESGEDS